MSHEWEMMASYHAFLIGSSIVRYDESERRYEISTPYQDSMGRLVLYATVADDGKIRITDNGHLSKNYMNRQSADESFFIEMGVQSDGSEDAPRMENDELVVYCSMRTFGQNVVSLAHSIMMIGTGKLMALMMIDVFKNVLARQGIQINNPAVEDQSGGGWPGGGTPFVA